MDLLSDSELRDDLSQRTSIVRATMYKATQSICKYNWYATGAHIGAMPGVQDMVDYGTVAVGAYHDEGMTFDESVQAGIKLMSQWAYNEGKGVVTRAKKMLVDGHKWGVGAVPTGGWMNIEHLNPPAIRSAYEDIDLIDAVTSMGLEPAEREALLLEVHGFTVDEMREQLGAHAQEILQSACEKAKEAWVGTP